tara:strand:+ start:425 stop:727 length:303 start_codon:yes stop_codon:yes gene_type:complete
MNTESVGDLKRRCPISDINLDKLVGFTATRWIGIHVSDQYPVTETLGRSKNWQLIGSARDKVHEWRVRHLRSRTLMHGETKTCLAKLVAVVEHVPFPIMV